MLNEFLSMFWSVSSRVPSYYFKARRATPFNEFRTNCFKSVQGNRWRDSIKLFKDIFIAYTRKRAETRNIYHHFIAVHLEATQSHGLNNLASDQSIEAAHHIVKQIGEPLRLPMHQLIPSQEFSAQQHLENMDQKIWLDSMVRHFQLRNSNTLL